MNEEQNIKKLLEEYKDFFEVTTADIAKSAKGKKIFFYVDSICGELYCLKEFSTPDELEHRILYEIAEQINMTLEDMSENVKKELCNIETLDFDGNNIESVNQLISSLETIQKRCECFNKVNNLLQGISIFMKKHKMVKK